MEPAGNRVAAHTYGSVRNRCVVNGLRELITDSWGRARRRCSVHLPCEQTAISEATAPRSAAAPGVPYIAPVAWTLLAGERQPMGSGPQPFRHCRGDTPGSETDGPPRPRDAGRRGLMSPRRGGDETLRQPPQRRRRLVVGRTPAGRGRTSNAPCIGPINAISSESEGIALGQESDPVPVHCPYSGQTDRKCFDPSEAVRMLYNRVHHS